MRNSLVALLPFRSTKHDRRDETAGLRIYLISAVSLLRSCVHLLASDGEAAASRE
jgi:hypothetical protein